jgi:hypothetical protein
MASLRALGGCRVTRWFGIEMALRDAGPDGLPDWQDESVPFLQLSRLNLILADGTRAAIITYQNDDRFGLCRDDTLPPFEFLTSEPGSIFRERPLDELPPGEIRSVSVLTSDGDIAEVRLDVDGREVLLWAGEVYEQADSTLRVVPMDESILVQVDGRRP